MGFIDGPLEVGPPQVGPLEVGPAQVGPLEVGLAQGGLTEVRSPLVIWLSVRL
jgi:hypothetical protein